VPPILASNLPQALAQAVILWDSIPKLLVATLRALNSLATSWASLLFALPNGSHASFPDQILTKPVIQTLIAILLQSPSSPLGTRQIELAADLITHCCVSDVSRNLLVKEGLLDTLGDVLASFALSTASSSHNPASPRSPMHSSIHHVLDALSAIVEGSNYRTHRLVYSPSLKRVLAGTKERTFYDDTQGPNFSLHQKLSHAISVENLLPQIMIQKTVSFGSHAFPSLSLASSRLLAEQAVMDSPTSSPLCVWLIHLARSLPAPSSQLAALRLLALVSNALDADSSGLFPDMVPKSRERERQIALLAVPIAVRLVADSTDALACMVHGRDEYLAVKNESCAVLALLIQNNVELQKAAHSAGAHKHIAQLLRKSFEPITLARPMWSPQLQSSEIPTPPSSTTTLGEGNLSREVVDALKVRAGALKAVAAVSERDDPIRKDLIDAGVAAYIIDSLTPFPDVGTSSSTSSYQAKDGNTVPVILAACQAATAMSRSVGNLRTSLIDAGLGKPVFALLKHPDNRVQIAATDVSINLVLDFSPMREVRAGYTGRYICMLTET